MKTYDEILSDMLAKVSNDLDKREGSVIYTAIAPCAAELAQQYIDIETILELSFASTSLGSFLELRTSEMGITRLLATKAIKKATFNNYENVLLDISIGSRFRIDNLVYAVLEKISDGVFALECETVGTIGNTPSGNLLPVYYISGLGSAVMSDIITPGTDDETDEKLLERYQLKVREPTTSGNAYQYKAWALEVTGVGDAKIFPLWNGNGTVKVVAVDNDKLPVKETVIADIVTHIEEVRPVGATVTVVSATAKEINISVTLTLNTGYTIETIKESLSIALKKYFKNVAFNVSFVSYAQIGLIMLGITGVLDYTNLKINNTQGNITLAIEEIPMLGTLMLEELTI